MFDSIVSDLSEGISYTEESGSFVISQEGNYYVSWSVNVSNHGAGSVKFGLYLGETLVAANDEYLTRGTVSGSALVNVSSVPVVLQLRNMNAEVTYDSGTDIFANMVIVQMA